MPIRALPPELVHRIAAGEVIERPASVVKELVENSLDAGARQVTIEIEGGGVRLIRVVDDGSGIPEAELPLAVQRHATSKLADWDDFSRLGSLGFRGEALASIAAVSDLTLQSRPADQATGAFILTRDGACVDFGRRAQIPGTAVTVRHVFRHLPGRLKFLRSDRAETGAVQNVVCRYALAYPDVKFRLIADERTTVATSGDGNLLAMAARLLNVPPTALAELRPAPVDGRFALSGVIGLPAASRPNRSGIFVAINRRPVENAVLRFALQEAYAGYFGTGRYPVGVLNLSLQPAELDVNVHPTKAEVRVIAERIVAGAIHRAVRETLAEAAPIPAWSEPNPPADEAGPAASSASRSPAGVSPTEPQPTFAPAPELFAQPLAAPAVTQTSLPPLRVLGQAGLTYVTAEGPDGIYLVDQHAAHERVTYERLRGQHGRRAIEQQGLLAPDIVDLDPALLDRLLADADQIQSVGFSVEPFGEAQVIVRAVPAVLAGRDPAASLRDILRSLDDRLDPLAWADRAITTLACHGSIRAGQQLTRDDMTSLLQQLEATPNARTCPHGRPTIVHLSASQLERQFGRR